MEEKTTVKLLRRSRTNKVFAGVCGGLGEYWGVDPVVLRLVWILVTVFTGFVPGVIAYILAALVIPEKSVEGVSSESVRHS